MTKVLLLIGAAAAWVLPLGARTIRVPAQAPTIQAGLDSLQDSDTVLVALGTYAEALYAPPLHFVLRGDVVPDTGDYPRPVIDPTPLPGSDTLSCLRLPWNSHPVVEDLVFRNGAAMYPHFNNDGGIMSWSADPVFRRIVMDSVFEAMRDYRGDGFITLESCRFWMVYDRAVWAHRLTATNCSFLLRDATVRGDSRSVIDGCRFDADQPTNYMLGIGADGHVTNCIFTSSVPTLSFTMSIGYSGTGVGPVEEISRNVFAGLRGAGPPITVAYNFNSYPTVNIHDNLFLEDSAACDECAGAIQLVQYWNFDQGVLSWITNNLFSNCSEQWMNGATAIYACAGAEIVGNRFFHLTPRNVPAVRMAYDSIESDLTLNDNLFFETGIALQNDQLNRAVDARWNWWGDSTGPYHATQNPGGRGDTIVGNVDFTPWYPDTSFLSVPGIGKPLPEQFVFEAYPNPFNSTVILNLIPPEVMIVRMELYDILGRRVKEIWSGPLAFRKQITFDGSDLASGIYFARVWHPIGNRPLAMAKLVMMR